MLSVLALRVRQVKRGSTKSKVKTSPQEAHREAKLAFATRGATEPKARQRGKENTPFPEAQGIGASSAPQVEGNGVFEEADTKRNTRLNVASPHKPQPPRAAKSEALMKTARGGCSTFRNTPHCSGSK